MFDAYDTATVQDAVDSATANFRDLPSALAYVRSQWTNFLAIGGKIVQLQTQVGQLGAQAAALGQTATKAWLDNMNRYLGQLDVMQGNMIDEYDYVSQGLNELGLDVNGNPSSGGAIPDSAFGFGQVPVNGWTMGALLAGAVLLAGTIGYVIYRYSVAYTQVQTVKSTLASLAAGKLNSDQATQIITKTIPTQTPGILDSIRGVAGYLAIGALAVFVVPKLLESTGRRGRR